MVEGDGEQGEQHRVHDRPPPRAPHRASRPSRARGAMMEWRSCCHRLSTRQELSAHIPLAGFDPRRICAEWKSASESLVRHFQSAAAATTATPHASALSRPPCIPHDRRRCAHIACLRNLGTTYFRSSIYSEHHYLSARALLSPTTAPRYAPLR
jgi:hypothetical protein